VFFVFFVFFVLFVFFVFFVVQSFDLPRRISMKRRHQ